MKFIKFIPVGEVVSTGDRVFCTAGNCNEDGYGEGWYFVQFGDRDYGDASCPKHARHSIWEKEVR